MLRASRKSDLSFEISGRLVEVDVDEGDHVEAGDRLARLDCERISARLQSAKASLQQANAVLAELEAGPRQETIATSKAEVASVNADVARLQKDFERSEQLFSTLAISRERFDAARFQLDAAAAKRDAAQKKLDELLAGSRIEQIDAQRASVARIESDVRGLELELEDGQLFAPFAGRIAARYLDEGTVVTPGTPAFQIIEGGELEAWIGLPPSAAGQLEIGSAYTGTVSDDTFEMKLQSLRPTLDPQTRTQNAVFLLSQDAAKFGLVDGQIVRMETTQRVEAKGIVLPTSALVPGPRGLWSLFVAEPSPDPETYTIEQRDVTLTDALGAKSLVSGTLQDGDRVVTEGVHRVVAGQAVSIVQRVESP